MKNKKKMAFLLVWIAFVMSVFASLSPASSYTFSGCKYSGSSPAISYRYFSVSSTFQTAFDQGQYAWDVTPVPGYFYPTSSSDPMINVYDASSYSGTWWALSSWGCSGGTYTSNETTVKMDAAEMSSLSAYQKKLVLIHELGHVYGLWHSGSGCSSSRVMSQGTTKFSCSGTAPWSNDQAGVIARY
jgi:hypothetical protein